MSSGTLHLPKEASSLTSAERAFVRQALEVYQKSLIRSRSKEITGSEIYNLRSRDVDVVTSLIGKFS